MITFAFTCTGPYAVLIMLGIKRAENRSAMPVPAKGRCAVSCSKSFCNAQKTIRQSGEAAGKEMKLCESIGTHRAVVSAMERGKADSRIHALLAKIERLEAGCANC